MTILETRRLSRFPSPRSCAAVGLVACAAVAGCSEDDGPSGGGGGAAGSAGDGAGATAGSGGAGMAGSESGGGGDGGSSQGGSAGDAAGSSAAGSAGSGAGASGAAGMPNGSDADAGGADASVEDAGGEPVAFVVTSPAVVDQPGCAPPPQDVNCDIFPFENTGLAGSPNVSPAFDWTGVPAGTQSFALALHDLVFQQNPGDPFTHWVIWDVPASETGLAALLPGEQNPGPPAPAGSRQVSFAANDGYAGSGACGNVYEFVLYALDVPTFTPANPNSGDAVEDEIAGSASVIGTATLRARSAEPNCG